MTYDPPNRSGRYDGFTLIELIVSIGLFALVMMLVSGSYIMMIGMNRHTQGLSTGIDSLSFALETMSRNIRTGHGYTCPGGVTDCTINASLLSFSFVKTNGALESYALGTQQGVSGIVGSITSNGAAMTDSSVNVTSLTFYVTGVKRYYSSPVDIHQPHVTIVVSGTVSSGAGKTEPFTIETGATMRGTDL